MINEWNFNIRETKFKNYIVQVMNSSNTKHFTKQILSICSHNIIRAALLLYSDLDKQI